MFDESRLDDSSYTVIWNFNLITGVIMNFLQSDINEDGYVNLLDLMIRANDCLKCTDPADPLNSKYE